MAKVRFEGKSMGTVNRANAMSFITGMVFLAKINGFDVGIENTTNLLFLSKENGEAVRLSDVLKDSEVCLGEGDKDKIEMVKLSCFLNLIEEGIKNEGIGFGAMLKAKIELTTEEMGKNEK